jgi:N-acetylneuraminate synthase
MAGSVTEDRQRTARDLRLDGLPCGDGHPPLLVAELSGNHGGRLENALRLIDAAAEAGADLVKIQTYRPDTITADSDRPEFLIDSGLWQGKTLYQLYEQAHTPWEWHPALFARARERGVPLFSSPFDDSAVDLLESLDCPLYKIASFELVDTGLLQRVARTGKPVILSTGMATLAEIDESVDTIRALSNAPLILLHCTSAYPAPIDEADLRTLAVLKERYRVPVGLSDHTTGSVVPVAATALGACLVERHFRLDDGAEAVDAAFSMTPETFRQLKADCRAAWQALGAVRDGPTETERRHLGHRRSLYAVRDIPAGARLTRDDVKSIRPAHGLHPRELPAVIGAVAREPIARATPLRWDLLVRRGEHD